MNLSRIDMFKTNSFANFKNMQFLKCIEYLPVENVSFEWKVVYGNLEIKNVEETKKNLFSANRWSGS